MIGGVVVVLLASVGGVWFAFVRHGGSSGNAAQRNRPACATARLHGRLGVLAWVTGGNLHELDLDRCRSTVAVDRGARPPVRFDADGDLIAYGDGAVVSTDGGRVRHPLGRLVEWAWSPKGRRLAGVTKSGRVLVSGIRGSPTTLVHRRAMSVAWERSGRSLAVGVADRLEVMDLDGGAPTVIYAGPKQDTVEPVVWSPGGRWVLFFLRSPGRPTAPLDAAPVSGGGYHNVFDPVLPYTDFLSWCQGTLALSGGGRGLPSQGQQVLTSAAPAWRTRNIARDFRSSWIWPACSPDGKRIAVTLTPNHTERPAGRGRRSLWTIGVRGHPRARLATRSHAAFEAPRWSGDGRVVMVVERKLNPRSVGKVFLIRVSRKTLKPLKTIGPVANVGRAPGRRGHTDWTETTDWYRPR